MKRLIVLVGLVCSAANAGSVMRAPLEDYLPTQNYAMFEIKTKMFQKLILDCQGFNMGVYFYENNKVHTQIHMDEGDCLDFHQFLTESNEQHRPVCLEFDAEAKYLEVTDKTVEECK